MEVSPRTAVDSSAANANTAAESSVDRKIALQPLDYAFQSLLIPVRKSLARIEAKLQENGVAAAHAPTNEMIPVPGASDPAIVLRLEALSRELAEFRRDALPLLQSAAHSHSSAEVPAASQPGPIEFLSESDEGRESWEEIIFGSELSRDAALNAVRQQFLNDVIRGGVSARALAGQLLLLQATPADELPERFRHVGEAYYRWKPRLSTLDEPLEQSLANWLAKRADEAGLRNTIQLVRPGDRFDGTRHSATTRGVEVVAVHGWIVLRDNQKVYTKASVSVQ